MKKNTYALTLDGDGFAAMRTDFNQCFNALIEKMISKEAETGSISISLKVTLNDGYAPDAKEVKYAAEREIISPKLEHTVTSTFQIRDKRTGLAGGDTYELTWDKDSNCWLMSKITDGQQSLFNNDGAAEDAGGDGDNDLCTADDTAEDKAGSMDYEEPKAEDSGDV